MKLNKTTIIADVICVMTLLIIFICNYLEMQNITVIDYKVLKDIFAPDFRPVQKIELSRSKCQNKKTGELFEYKFGGVGENCVKNDAELMNETCPVDAVGNNYTKVESIGEKNLNVWRNKILCAEYASYASDNYSFVNKNDDCKSGFKKCGIINSVTNKTNITKNVCILKENDCPLNFLDITNDTAIYDNDKYDKQQLDGDYYLVTSNKLTNNSIILNVTISEGIYPCFIRGRFSTVNRQFPGMKNINYFTCKISNDSNTSDIFNHSISYANSSYIDNGYDIRFIQIDALLKYNFLKDNDLDYSYSKLPNISNTWTQDINISYFYLFYRDSYLDKDNCDPFENFEQNIESLRVSQYVRMVFGLLHFVLYILAISVLGVIKVVVSWYHDLLFVIKIILSYGFIVYNCWSIYVSLNKTAAIDSFDNFNSCFDEVSEQIKETYKIVVHIRELTDFYSFERIIWYIYISGNVLQTLRLIHKIIVRIKNKERRKIVYQEIGKEQLEKIFETVRSNQIKAMETKRKISKKHGE